jgi:hypothetical protein
LTQRKYRSEIIPPTATAIHSLGQRNSQYLHYQRGTVWYYWNNSLQQKDIITLTGTGGTASITKAGYLTKTITFVSTLPATATAFVAANAAAYLAKGITLTAGTGTLIFEAVTAGVGFHSPVITNVTTDLAGTVVNTVVNETTVKDTLTAASGRIEEFNTGTTRYTLLFNGTDRYSWDGTTAVSLTNAPATNKFTVHKGRVYALLGSELKFSALNVLNDWTTVNDAGSISITNARGDGTGIVTYNDYVTVFTKYSMHQLYGTGPDSYELKDVPTNIGCVSDRSVVICNDILYWVWYDGLYMFDGSIPEKVSYKMDYYFNEMKGYESIFDKIACGVQGDFIFISIPYSDATSRAENLMVIKYDTKNNTFYPWSNTRYDAFTALGNVLYGIEGYGTIPGDAINFYKNVCKVEDDNATTDVTSITEWQWHSGPRLKGSVSKNKTLTELWIVYDLPVGSNFFIYTSPLAGIDGVTDDGTNQWTLAKTITGADSNPTRGRVQVSLDSVPSLGWYRIMLRGSGPCTIHYATEKYRVK